MESLYILVPVSLVFVFVIGWALAYNAIALPLAALGWIGPWEAALGMSASSFIVVLNAMRPLAAPLPWKASTSSSRSRSYSYS